MAAGPDVANLGAARPAPLPGEPPNPASPPPGCAFHPRCPLAVDVCRTVTPPLVRKASGQLAACHVVPDAPEVTP
jgi:oligopeptide/dipeptide ABC transporter ATP-binding protein